MTLLEYVQAIVSRGHKADDVIAEIHYRVRHGWPNELAAVRSMYADMLHDWGFTYLHKRNLSAVEHYRQDVGTRKVK